MVRTHTAVTRGLSSLIRGLDRQIERVGQEIPAVTVLRTIPGIGPYRGLLIATAAGTWRAAAGDREIEGRARPAELCAELREMAPLLVDALGIPDGVLSAVNGVRGRRTDAQRAANPPRDLVLAGRHASPYEHFLTELIHQRPRTWKGDVERLHGLLNRLGEEACLQALQAALFRGIIGAEHVEKLATREGIA